MTAISPGLNPEQLRGMRKRVFLISLMMAGAALASGILYSFMLVDGYSLNLVFLISGSAILLLVAIVNLFMLFRNRLDNTWRMLFIAQLVYVFSSFVLMGWGWANGLTVALLALAIMAQFSREYIPTWLLYSTVVSAALIYLVDLYSSFQRLELQSPWLFYQIAVTVIPALFYLYFSLRDFRSRSLRVKLTVTFIIVSTLTLLPVITYLNYSTRTTLTQRENQKLINTGKQVAAALDSFVNTTLNSVEVEASFGDFVSYLLLSPSQREDESHALAIMRTLQSKDPSNIVSYALLDTNGIVLLDSSDVDTGTNLSDEEYFEIPYHTGKSFMSSPQVLPNGSGAFYYFAAAIRDDSGRILGVLRVKYRDSVLQDIIVGFNNQTGLSSFAILLDEYNVVLGHGRDRDSLYKLLLYSDLETIQELRSRERLPTASEIEISLDLSDFYRKVNRADAELAPIFLTEMESYDVQNTHSIERAALCEIDTQPWKVVFAQKDEITLQPLEQQTRTISLLVMGISVLLVFLAITLSALFVAPAQRLTRAAEEIAQGELEVIVSSDSNDEFGLLAKTFNDMTERIRQSMATLEMRVAERTQDLEQRAHQIQAAAEIGGAAAKIRDVNQLLPDVTEMLSERFGYYHVGIFLVNETEKYAVLKAANSEGGRSMLARGHRLQVGAEGIVGYVTSTGLPRISLDVGDDAVFFDNPDLPDTRSEMALPLIARGKIIGALDIQSEEENAFAEFDVTVLRLVSEQVAVAIENARLLNELQNAVDATRRAYGDVTADAWADRTAKQAVRGYVVHSSDVALPLDNELASSPLDQVVADLRDGLIVQLDPHSLAVPIKIRELVVGFVRLQKDTTEPPWIEEEVRLMRTIADRLGAALENARLYRETQLNAARDRLVREISDRMRRAADMDTLIQTAVREMSRVLGVKGAFAQISSDIFSDGDVPSEKNTSRDIDITDELLSDGETT